MSRIFFSFRFIVTAFFSSKRGKSDGKVLNLEEREARAFSHDGGGDGGRRVCACVNCIHVCWNQFCFGRLTKNNSREGSRLYLEGGLFFFGGRLFVGRGSLSGLRKIRRVGKLLKGGCLTKSKKSKLWQVNKIKKVGGSP